MSEAQHQRGSVGGGIDLSQFYQIFFDEAKESLDSMEQMLLSLDLANADDEALNAIFRCAHSIKGGAATFGFTDVAELTHQMESLLDKLRRRELQPTSPMVDVLLASADALRGLLARHQGREGEVPVTTDLVHRIRDLTAGKDPLPAPSSFTDIAKPEVTPVGAVKPKLSKTRSLEIHIGPLDNPEQADVVQDFFRDMPGLGTIKALVTDRRDVRVFAVETTSTDEDLLDLFVFHVRKEHIVIHDMDALAKPDAPGFGFHKGAPGAPVIVVEPTPAPPPVAVEMDFGFFADAPGAPDPVATEVAGKVVEWVEAKPAVAPPVAARPVPNAGASTSDGTIRVAISKVDQLINLVGELVITQAMLAQNSTGLDPVANQQLLAGLADLNRNTRDLQESVMSIRMMPMSIVFSRFPRMLRDLAGKLGKKVELITLGKGLVEKITDPLTHLVRNSCDHGIELPEERVAAGKSPHGTITLSAVHQGGSIVIEVRDDGRGMSRDRILSVARERGLDVNDHMTDSEVWQLIFAPGFSTADVVTDVSGRGVGMDVVKRNIAALNGTVDIDSAEGYGMLVSVRLPLTLAIMDGMSVGVGDEVYLLPLSSVIESFQVKGNDVSTVGQGAQLVKVRDDYMPVVSLEKVFQVPRSGSGTSSTIMVVIESDGSRVALLVDALLGQQQVVVKNLESNYKKVPNVSGATILGDGKVALILDTAALVRRSRH
jgi:two-component system, chemotaxis family, sensor kinase CheA